MYICENCGKVFVDCDFIDEPRPYGMGVVYEQFPCCPECKSMDIEEAVECRICGETKAKIKCYDDICEDCEKKTLKKFYEMVTENFNEAEIYIILDKTEPSDLL